MVDFYGFHVGKYGQSQWQYGMLKIDISYISFEL